MEKRQAHTIKDKKQKIKKGSVGTIFASLTVTIALLIFLAALSVIGTLIPQNAPEQTYLQRYSQETYYILKGLGLFDMYHSWWFIAVLALLALNVVTCTVKRLPRIWHQARRDRNSYARFGTLLTHLSILLILLGGLINARWGFKGYVEVREGEAFVVSAAPTPGEKPQAAGFVVRCDAFRVERYPDGSPREYVSTLTFLEGERVILHQRLLRVNHPLSYRGLNFYQASYGVSARPVIEVKGQGVPVRMQLTQGEIRPITGTGSRLGFMQYQPAAQGEEEKVLFVLFPPGSSPEPFWLSKLKPARAGGLIFTIKDLATRPYTGIQVTRNPGMSLVWVGCSLLIVGMVATFTLRTPPKKREA
jgi:cytochrome c biogenesis protein